MPHPVIHGYLTDPSIDIEKKQNLLQKMASGGIDENDVASKIQIKYGNKYSATPQPSPTRTVAPPSTPQNNSFPNAALGGLFGGLGQSPKSTAPRVNQPVNSTPNSMNAALGAIGPDFIKGLANPATLQNNPALNNFNAQGTASAIQSLGNQASFVTKGIGALNPINPASQPVFNQGGDWIKNRTEQMSNNIKQESYKRNGTDENSMSSVLGNATGSIVGSLPSLYAGGEIANGAGISSEALKNAPAMTRLLGFGARSGLSTSAATIPGQGRLPNAEELKNGAILDAIFYGTGAAADKVGNFLYSRTVPATITQAAKDIKNNVDVGEALSQTGISLTRKGEMNKATKIIGKLSSQLDDDIAKEMARNPNKTFSINDFLGNLKEKVLKNPNLKATPLDRPAVEKAIDEVADNARALYGNKKLTLAEVQALKKEFHSGLQTEFDKAVGAKLKADPAAQMALASNLRETIEKNVPNAKGINKKLAPLLTAAQRAEKKAGYRGLLYDLLAGGNYAAYQGVSGQSSNSPADFVKNTIIGGLLRRGMTSTLAKTTTGSALKSYSKTAPAISQLLKIIQNNK